MDRFWGVGGVLSDVQLKRPPWVGPASFPTHFDAPTAVKLWAPEAGPLASPRPPGWSDGLVRCLSELGWGGPRPPAPRRARGRGRRGWHGGWIQTVSGLRAGLVPRRGGVSELKSNCVSSQLAAGAGSSWRGRRPGLTKAPSCDHFPCKLLTKADARVTALLT